VQTQFGTRSLGSDWEETPKAPQSGNHEQRTVLPSVENVTMDRKRSASEKAVDQTAQNLGEAIRSQYDLARPLPDTLNASVARLRGLDRRTNRFFRRAIAQPSGVTSVETAVEARGGLLGRPVLAILIISTVLLVGALAITYHGVLG
jgi:hypothetical protein